MKHLFALLLCMCLYGVCSAAEDTLEITARDGRVFREATVERVTPSCVDIGYVKDDGNYAMIGLPLSQLTDDWQKHFNYDPEKAKAFEEKVQSARQKNMEETVEAEATRMARIVRELKAKLSGQDIQIKSSDLRFAIYGRRRSVVVIPVEKVRSGTVVAVREDSSGLPELPALILIDGLDLEPGSGSWSGFIFPTGMKARYKEQNKMPVFSDSLDDAQLLLERYLDIYSEFAANEKDKTTDSTENAPPEQSSGIAGLDGKGSNVPNNSYWSYDSYFLGNSYYPVYWYYRRYPNYYYPQFRPRPPRPHPHPQPQPPRPHPQPQPPRPQPGGGGGRLQGPVERRGNFRQAPSMGGGGIRIVPPTGPVSGGR